MTNLKYLLIAASAVFAFNAAPRAQSLADFGVPAAAETPAQKEAQRQVAAPGEVKHSKNASLGQEVISAKTNADAIKAGNQELMEEGEGVRCVATSSGVGIIGAGGASYPTNLKNPNLVLLAQRNAFVIAVLKAKREIATYLKGCSLEGKQFFSEQIEALDTAEGASMANTESRTEESTSASIRTMLKGMIVFDMKDDPEAGAVVVSVLTSPQTQGAVQTGPGGNMTAESLETGVNEVFKQIRTGTIPPEGGYTIVVPDSGQIAWVGYGSDIARKNNNKTIQRKLFSKAKSTSKLRARRALLGVITGEQVQFDMKESEAMHSKIQQFDSEVDADGNVTETAKAQESFSAAAKMAFSESGGNITSGELPEGVAFRTYTTPDGNWAYSVAVYMAAMTEAAKAAAQQMAANSPVKAGSVGNYQVNPDGSFTVKDGKLIPKSMGSGKIGRGLKGF